MNKQEAHKRIQNLKELINKHRYEYHVLNTQTISDEALDSLKHELSLLEQSYPEFVTPDSPTQRVAGKALDDFAKVTHKRRMISLNDIFNFEELSDWEARNKKIVDAQYEYVVELKIDGFAISLIYRDGVLVTAATRGDGLVGEDVTQNVKTIESIPLTLREKISGEVEVRGEIFMSKKAFDAINKQQAQLGEKLYANPRNLAAGTIRQLDPALAASRKLDFFAYELFIDDKSMPKIVEHERLRELGFKTSSHTKLVSDIAGVQRMYDAWSDKREKQDFLIDGLVIKINDPKVRDTLGIVGKAPRGMCAYKFPAQQVTTVVKGVDWSVGRTGVLTPVATFEPVSVAGTTVQHATIHNMDEIRRLDVRIGDTVIIEKAGDIIPKIVTVLAQMRTGKEKVITAPSHCPVCGSVVQQAKGEVAIRCSNNSCFASEVSRLIHFVSKKAFDIEGLGEKVVEQLAVNGLIASPADLYKLTIDDFLTLEGFKEKSATNAFNAIQAKK
ncbi:NAD-dependent DNA ligase LigA, partial [Candidatus Falkowbacteria bacterium]|nr:NAD-dependent DNA ligase LigA [Candidatus Falkowbacteria bacterium]